MVFVLKDATPAHDVFSRRGPKDIVFAGSRLEKGQVTLTCLDVRSTDRSDAVCDLR